MTWRISGWYHKVETGLKEAEKQEEKFNNLQKTLNREFRKSMALNIKSFRRRTDTQAKQIASIQSDIKDLIKVLGDKDPELYKLFAMKKSPLNLTPTGLEVFDIVKGQQFIDENKDLLMKKLEERQPRTALDVEIGARLVCLDLLSEPIFDRIKNIVYNHPALKITTDEGKMIDYAFSISDVCYILSFPIRDLYLDLHPELRQDQDSKE